MSFAQSNKQHRRPNGLTFQNEKLKLITENPFYFGWDANARRLFVSDTQDKTAGNLYHFEDEVPASLSNGGILNWDGCDIPIRNCQNPEFTGPGYNGVYQLMELLDTTILNHPIVVPPTPIVVPNRIHDMKHLVNVATGSVNMNINASGPGGAIFQYGNSGITNMRLTKLSIVYRNNRKSSDQDVDLFPGLTVAKLPINISIAGRPFLTPLATFNDFWKFATNDSRGYDFIELPTSASAINGKSSFRFEYILRETYLFPGQFITITLNDDFTPLNQFQSFINFIYDT